VPHFIAVSRREGALVVQNSLPLNVNIERWSHHANRQVLQVEAINGMVVTSKLHVGQPNVVEYDVARGLAPRKKVVYASPQLATRRWSLLFAIAGESTYRPGALQHQVLANTLRYAVRVLADV
jgi:hypothetical protein